MLPLTFRARSRHASAKRKRYDSLLQLRRYVAIRPGVALERRQLGPLRHLPRRELRRQRQPGVHHLPAGGDLQVAVAAQARLVTTPARAEGRLRRHVTDAAVRQRHREREGKAAPGFQVEPELTKELRRVGDEDGRADLDGLDFDL